MTGGQFATKARKLTTLTDSGIIKELFQLYKIDNLLPESTMEETVYDFLKRMVGTYNYRIKSDQIGSKYTAEQLKANQEWQNESRRKAAKNLSSKPKKKIKPMTKARLKRESSYERVKAKIKEKRPPVCQGCGCGSCALTFSHTIPRSRSITLLSDPDNINLDCIDCHPKRELGLYDELLNGEESRAYIKRKDPEFYWIMFYKSKSA